MEMYRIGLDKIPLHVCQLPVYPFNQPSTHLSVYHSIHIRSLVYLSSPFSHHPFCHLWLTPLVACHISTCTTVPCSRIYEILPQRIQQWQQSPCIAEEHGKKLLERIRREQQNARTRLQEMERRFHELEAIIARAKQQAVREDEEVSKHGTAVQGPVPGPVWPHHPFHSMQSNEGDSDDTDLQIFCVSCGHPINPRVALRHMERCYAKVRVSAWKGRQCGNISGS